jgi:hypothetical protein
VREFGTIYEGLLESSLGLAEVDLTLDEKGTWLPAKKKDEVWAYAGQVYFHNTSGQRKGTGSYFTPSFVVEHLLERSLDPALDAHLEKVAVLLAKGDQAGAGELFFDFRVADLAMGSGHFLTAAIDHIEQRMAAFLADDSHVIPGVTAELQKLERAAIDALGPDAPEPERSSLLRRQIARRCIYGLDINPIAVELARVSIWIHTFVRGLPMSSLDHNLVCANSLTGIGSIDEALDIVVANRRGQASFYDAEFTEILERSRKTLADAALLAEATKEESRLATKAAQRALKEAEQARFICDAAVLIRSQVMPDNGLDPSQLSIAAAHPERQELLEPIRPGHMPVLFPEVFLRSNPGFDVLIGNPPWKQLMVDELDFWNRYSSGLHALNEDERVKKVRQLRLANPDKVLLYEKEVKDQAELRSAILSGPYPGLGTGGRAPDLYPPFAWRNLGLCRYEGNVGIVLPRSILSGSVNREWRKVALETSRISLVTLHNRKRWVFDITEQQSIVLLNLQKVNTPPTVISVSGPFDEAEKFLARPMKFGTLDIDAIVQSSEELNFPDLSSVDDVEVFRQMRLSPRFDQATFLGDFRVVSEFNATTDKQAFSGGTEREGWAVIGGKGFELWKPHLENVFAWAKPEKVVKALRAKLKNQVRLTSSEFFQYCNTEDVDSATLPCERPRIAFRDMARAKDARTMIACLLPANVILTNKAPYVLRRSGGEADEAYLLGVMSSLVFDWFAKRYVELGVSLHIARMLPIPAPDISGDLKSRLIMNSARLAAVDARYSDWAEAAGVNIGSVKTVAEKDSLIAENDALVAHLYGLSRSQLEHVFRTFHRGWDYAPRLEAVLAFYDKLPKVS